MEHAHEGAQTARNLRQGFVIHSLRHTMLTRLGESGADAFTVMRIAGYSSVTLSQRCAHPTPEGMAPALERLEKLKIPHS